VDDEELDLEQQHFDEAHQHHHRDIRIREREHKKRLAKAGFT